MTTTSSGSESEAPDQAVASRRERYRHAYERYAPFLVILIGIAAATGIWVGATAAIGNARQDEANAKLLDCLNDYAGANSSSTKAVRDAAEAKDIAVAHFNGTLNGEGEAFLRLVRALINPDTKSTDYPLLLQTLERTLEVRADAGQQVIDAQAVLDKARKDNPVPDPPAIFCDLTDKERDVQNRPTPSNSTSPNPTP